MRYVAGLGCRRGCALSQLRDLLLHTLALHQLPLSALAGLASSQHKQAEAALSRQTEQIRQIFAVFGHFNILIIDFEIINRIYIFKSWRYR